MDLNLPTQSNSLAAPSPAATPRLSVAILARNCASALVATIESIQNVAAEIVVLDTGSTDNTVTTAVECGALVHRYTWEESFASARNACLAKATGDWVLWLDAGETMTAEQAAELAEFVAVGANPAHVYQLAIQLPAALGQLGPEQIVAVRLHPRRAGLEFAGRIRERLDDAIVRLELQVDRLPLVIHRSPRDHEPAVKAAKAQRNIRLVDLALAEMGPAAELHNLLGEAFQALGDSARASQHYRRALSLAMPGSRDQLEAYYGLLTSLDVGSADRADQLTLAMLALEHFPLDTQLLVALGGYLQSLEQPELAVRSFDVAFRHGQIEAQIWHLPEIREIAASCAAATLVQLGRDDEACSLLEAAVRICPESHRLVIQLVELHVQHGRRDEARQAAAGFPSVVVGERLATAARGACLAQLQQWPAAADLLQAALLDGCRERFCLEWLVKSWLALARPLDAQGVLQIWQDFDPANPEVVRLAAEIEKQLADCEVRVDSAISSKSGKPAGAGRPPLTVTRRK
jgi:tetratricopeptide (TPR) repeat protein